MACVDYIVVADVLAGVLHAEAAAALTREMNSPPSKGLLHYEGSCLYVPTNRKANHGWMETGTERKIGFGQSLLHLKRTPEISGPNLQPEHILAPTPASQLDLFAPVLACLANWVDHNFRWIQLYSVN